MLPKTFASDNYSGVHPEIMDALISCNEGHARSYGNDEYTIKAIQTFKKFFGDEIDVCFVFNGTGANVLGLSSMTDSYNAVLCANTSHVYVDESTAPEKFTGCRFIPLDTINGKMSVEEIEKKIKRIGDEHHPQVKVLSLAQTTEYGTVYDIDELKAISSCLKKHGLFLHMDGARIFNAAVALNCDLKEFTKDVGVDVLSFGGTKNGMMFGEAVVFLNNKFSESRKFRQKQSMQLSSKMRFIAAQFDALLNNNLWYRNASHANNMAKLLAKKLEMIPEVIITKPVQANVVFAILPKEFISKLQELAFFYVWDDKMNEVRLMCSFDTNEDEINNFIESFKDFN
jgi:threonine aldolase